MKETPQSIFPRLWLGINRAGFSENVRRRLEKGKTLSLISRFCGKKYRCDPRILLPDAEKEKIKVPPRNHSSRAISGSRNEPMGEPTLREGQLAILDNFCLTISLTAFPSARPVTLPMTAFMTFPWSLGPAAPVSAIVSSTSPSSSDGERAWGR